MKNKKALRDLILIALLFVILIFGAVKLYDVLSAQVESQTLDALESAAPAVTVAPAETSEAAAQPTAKPAEVAGPMPKANLARVFTVYEDSGEAVSLIDMRGKPTVVNFFASWCGPCKMEMPHFDEAFKTYGEEINFMMVNLCAYGNDTKENGKKLVAEGGWTFPVYFDTEGEAVTAYNVRSMPTTIFVSADGELVSTRIGMLTQSALQSEIDKLLAR